MKKKVLIVDDSQTTRMTIDRMLGEEFEKKQASNGAEALEILRQDQSYSLIIMDINMPELNGMEFIKIQSETENIKNIPTMMCTTEASRPMKEKAKQYGVVKAWVIKPIIKELFVKAVKHVIK
ncbi:response regulator [Bacteriovoracales bacterium]|nr:response regulator [Bacteriovoracales bacterium]